MPKYINPNRIILGLIRRRRSERFVTNRDYRRMMAKVRAGVWSQPPASGHNFTRQEVGLKPIRRTAEATR